MTEPTFAAYLRAKRTVDDRALDAGVLARAARALADVDGPIRVIELGVGLGDSLPRLLDRGLFPPGRRVAYLGVDRRAALLRAARRRLRGGHAPVGGGWTSARGRTDESDAGTGADAPSLTTTVDADGRLRVEGGGVTVSAEYRTDDAFDALERADHAWDLVIAQSFLDLLDPIEALERIVPALDPGGRAYLPLTFDGGTVFEPTPGRLLELDRSVVDAYHATMTGGDPRAGRHVLAGAPEAGATVEAAAGADWVVHPVAGRYPANEARFLGAILSMIERSVRGATTPAVPDGDLDRWLAHRRRQLDAGRLVYVAHQLDLLVAPGDGSGSGSGTGTPLEFH